MNTNWYMSDYDVESRIDDTIQISTLELARAVLSEQQNTENLSI